MHVIIKAEGYGRRLAPLTNQIPKPMLSLSPEVSIISRLISQLEICGFESITLTLGYRGDQIQSHLDTYNFAIPIYYVYSTDGHPSGTATCVANVCRDWHRPFLLLSADIYTDYRFDQLRNQTPQWGHLVLVHPPSFAPNGDFHLQQGRLDPKRGPRMTYANIAVVHPQSYRIIPCPKEEGDLWRQYIDKGHLLTGESFHGTWINIGTPTLLHQAQRLEKTS